MSVVHEKHECPIVFGEIAGSDVLPIPGEVREAERLLVQHVNEALGSSAMLYIGLPLRIRGRKVDAVAVGNESGEVGSYRGLPSAFSFHPAVHLARASA